jgi:hypothetical protein
MARGHPDMTAVDAAVSVARQHGLEVTEPHVLRDRLNVLVHLRPAPVVARVAGTIARVRPGDDWLRRELAVAASLDAAGAPVVAPSPELPPGPHHHEGRVLSFWTYIDHQGPPDPAAAGAALHDVHEALRGFHGSLPALGHVTEAEALLAHLAAEELRATMTALRGPIQPLHGDSHLRNVLNGPGGPLWNDWEDTCIGPVHWDAACLLATHRVTGTEPGAEVALRAAGLELDPAELNLWIEARVLQGAIWTIYTGNPAGSAWIDHALGRR